MVNKHQKLKTNTSKAEFVETFESHSEIEQHDSYIDSSYSEIQLNPLRKTKPEKIQESKTNDSENYKNVTQWARVIFKEYDDHFNADKSVKAKIKTKFEHWKSKFASTPSFLDKCILWRDSLKSIESTYGGSYASFFKFIRWLFLFNVFICVLTVTFIIVPQLIYKNEDLKILSNYSYAEESYSKIIKESCSVFILGDSNLNDPYLGTKCCTNDYEDYIDSLSKNRSSEQTILDIIQGTGIMENTFLFYGYYSNRTSETNQNMKPSSIHVYYMGLAFVMVTMINLFLSAIMMILRLGKGLKIYISRIEDTYEFNLCTEIFCSWDYQISNEKFAKNKKSILRKYLESALNDIKRIEGNGKLKFAQKLALLLKRIAVSTILIVLFGASGYGIYALTTFSRKEGTKGTTYYKGLIFEYLPTIGIQTLNFIFPILCFHLSKLENYNYQATLTLYIVRTGLVRLGSIMFLIISIMINVFANKDVCSSQSNSLLLTFVGNQSENATIKCWETYVGQQFYKLIILSMISKIITVFLVEFPISKLANIYSFFEKIKFEFSLAIKFLDVLYVQTIFWFAFFFSPFLSVLAVVYYFLSYYLLLFSLKYNCKISRNQGSQSKLNMPFNLVLFLVFIFVLLINGLIFSLVKPSRSCGPFRLHDIEDFFIYTKLKNSVEQVVPNVIKSAFHFFMSYLFAAAMVNILLLLIWILNGYSKAHAAMAKSYRKIISEERNKNTKLSGEVSYLEQRYCELCGR